VEFLSSGCFDDCEARCNVTFEAGSALSWWTQQARSRAFEERQSFAPFWGYDEWERSDGEFRW
jgi:hypothetical protein